MLYLDATTRKIQALMGEVVTTTNPTVVAAWADFTTTATTPGATPSNLNGVTAVDIVAAPSGSTQRKVNGITINNIDTVSHVVTVRYNDNATLYKMVTVTLAVGDQLSYTDVRGWAVIDAAGNAKATGSGGTGRVISTSVLTSGTTVVSPPNAVSAFVRMVGGGGGGGGCTSVGAAAGAAGGGGAGGYAEKTFTVTPNTSYTYQVGAAGTGVSGAGGNNGTSSTFAVGATTVTAFFGSGAPVDAPAATLKAAIGGAGGAISTNGDVNGAGENGAPGIILIVAGPILVSGNGGSSQFGAGGIGIIAVGNGNPGIGPGAGGGGAATGASTVRTGGNGTAGIIIVDWYT